MAGFNIGDVLFQLFSLGFIVLIIVLIVMFFRSITKRRNQLDSIEKKLDAINEEIKRDNG